jgi:hypothetical protein
MTYIKQQPGFPMDGWVYGYPSNPSMVSGYGYPCLRIQWISIIQWISMDIKIRLD